MEKLGVMSKGCEVAFWGNADILKLNDGGCPPL